MLNSIVVGYGRAGRDFHLPAVRHLRQLSGATRGVAILDPLAPHVVEPPTGVVLGTRLAEVEAAFPPTQSVVHVCTPPDTHARVIREFARAGFTRMLVEKPLVTTRQDLDLVRDLARIYGLDLVVVANWTTSRLTECIAAELARRRDVGVERVEMVAAKSRIGRSLSNGSHRSAFDVEMPHLVALALHLCGPELELLQAAATDLVVGHRRLPMMGTAMMSLRSPAGCEIAIHTDLASPVRARSVSVRWQDLTALVGYFPCDSSDVYSRLRVFGPDGLLAQERMVKDDTVLTQVHKAYEYFEGRGPKPPSDLPFYTEVTALLLEAKRRSRSAERACATHEALV